jgi:hypothetical protein
MQLMTLLTQPLDQVLIRRLQTARAQVHLIWRREVSHAATHIRVLRPLALGLEGVRSLGYRHGEFLTFAQVSRQLLGEYGGRGVEGCHEFAWVGRAVAAVEDWGGYSWGWDAGGCDGGSCGMRLAHR